MDSGATDAFSAKFIHRVVRNRAPMFAVAFALLFTIIAVAQYLFVRHGVYRSAELQLLQAADQIAAEIAFKDKWDLTAHRQSADIQALHIFVVTSEGVVVETSGFIPGLIGPVRPLDESIFTQPKTVKVLETGETWREYAVRVRGGVVALGILNPQDVSAPDAFLTNAAREFGSTIEDAAKVRTRQIPSQVDYAVVDDSGNLLFEADWFPLKLEPSSLSQFRDLRGLVERGGKSYLVVSKSITDSHGNTVGTILIPKEVTGEVHVIRQHILFNAIATLAS